MLFYILGALLVAIVVYLIKRGWFARIKGLHIYEKVRDRFAHPEPVEEPVDLNTEANRRIKQHVSHCTEEYSSSGVLGALISCAVGLGITGLVLVFIITLSSSIHTEVEPQINSISNANVKDAVKAAAVEGFGSMYTIANLLPTIVLAVVVGAVLLLIMGVMSPLGDAVKYVEPPRRRKIKPESTGIRGLDQYERTRARKNE